MMIRALTVIALTLSWCVLWGEFSFANVASGVIVSAGSVAVLGMPESNVKTINPKALARFSYLVMKDTVLSTFAVASEVLTPTDYTDELTQKIKLPPGSENHLLALTLAVTLTPGTAVIATDRNEPSLTVHLLHAERLAATIAHVHELAETVDAAWPCGPIPEVKDFR